MSRGPYMSRSVRRVLRWAAHTARGEAAMAAAIAPSFEDRVRFVEWTEKVLRTHGDEPLEQKSEGDFAVNSKFFRARR